MNPKIENREECYYAILKDLTFKEVRSLKEGFNVKSSPLFAVKVEFKGKTKSYYDESYFIHSKYTFYDNDLKIFYLTESGWSLEDINEPLDNRKGLVIYKISDPIGEIRSISNYALNKNSPHEYSHLKGICKIISYIRELTKHPDWSHSELKAENDLLKAKIIELKEKLLEFENINSKKSQKI